MLFFKEFYEKDDEGLMPSALIRIPFQKLILSRKYLFSTMQDCAYNRGSMTTAPIIVNPVEDENYLLTDGYHRVFEKLLQGAESIYAYINTVNKDYPVPVLKDRFRYNSIARYKGLENLADESILKNIRKILGK